VSNTEPIEATEIDEARMPVQRSPQEGSPEDDRAPNCPRCHKRLVILSTHWWRAPSGASIRRQFWGCPRGHSSAYRMNGIFGPIEVYPDAVE